MLRSTVRRHQSGVVVQRNVVPQVDLCEEDVYSIIQTLSYDALIDVVRQFASITPELHMDSSVAMSPPSASFPLCFASCWAYRSRWLPTGLGRKLLVVAW
jgi:hypothetical protein